ncbi:hypothetical protein BCV72DRAFT_264710 [Rhizopus microsporus var. microsporus]|uniref:Uncharacterized protein n=1 Tax=Rhizopus microsporus var. microsporus TaxID=86635 RepID=A0A1X0QTU5_RHIZD|nr:hypothetical protein BCV72DRAFT_264710 [Rhizopus microsporus var. microsporus]
MARAGASNQSMRDLISKMKDEPFGVRLECGFVASNWDRVLHSLLEQYRGTELQSCIQWHPSRVFWNLVLDRLNALVAVADSMRTQKELLYTVPSFTGFAFVVYMLSSLSQRPSDWSHLSPVKDKLKEFSCPRPSLLFVPGRFKRTDDKQHWYGTVSMRKALSSIYGNKLLRRILEDSVHTESVDSTVTSGSSVFHVVAPTPLILESGWEFFWLAVLYFKAYGPSTACVAPFTQLLLKELLSKANILDKFTKDLDSVQQAHQLGHSFFKDLSNLDLYFKAISYLVPTYLFVILRIEKYLFPSFDAIKTDNEAAVAVMQRRYCWRKYEFRAAYITLCINHPEFEQELVKFRDKVLKYIYENYEFVPNLAKDSIWSTSYGYEIVKIVK